MRESFDLFTKNGRLSFFKRGWFGDAWAREFVWIDTIGHHVCSLIGHSKKTYEWQEAANEPSIRVCYRCNNPALRFKQIWSDIKMQQVWEDYIIAINEHSAKMDRGELTVDNFTEDWRETVEPARKRYEEHQEYLMKQRFRD